MFKSGAKENINQAVIDEGKGLFYDLDINLLKKSLHGKTQIDNIFYIIEVEDNLKKYITVNQKHLDQEKNQKIETFLNELRELSEIISLTPWLLKDK